LKWFSAHLAEWMLADASRTKLKCFLELTCDLMDYEAVAAVREAVRQTLQEAFRPGAPFLQDLRVVIREELQHALGNSKIQSPQADASTASSLSKPLPLEPQGASTLTNRHETTSQQGASYGAADLYDVDPVFFELCQMVSAKILYKFACERLNDPYLG